MDKSAAFTLFAKRNANFQEERDAASRAWDTLTETEQQYVNDLIATEFSEALQAVSIDAHFEMVSLLGKLSEAHPLPDFKFQYTFHDWHAVTEAIAGSKYERLHYAALFGFNNNDALMAHARERVHFEEVAL
jgi:hypothetical protein